MNIDFWDLLALWVILSLGFWIRPIFFTHRWRGPLVLWLILCALYWVVPVAGWVISRP